MDSANILFVVLEWAWVSLFAAVGWLWIKVFGMDARIQVLENSIENAEKDRDEIKQLLRDHNDGVRGGLARLDERIHELDVYLRNGHNSG